jgi:hypothetical protein
VATVTAVRLLLALSVLAAALAATAAAAPAAGPDSCKAPEALTHNEVVFGHFATMAAALKVKRAAERVKFKGLKIENDGCGDYELEIDGADDTAGRVSVAAEAAKAGFQVTFEQTAPPMRFKQGEVVGIFDRFATVAAANALMQRLAAVNFRYIDLVRVGGKWLVVMPQVPVKHALSVAAEVHKAGFRIAFQPGSRTG